MVLPDWLKLGIRGVIIFCFIGKLLVGSLSVEETSIRYTAVLRIKQPEEKNDIIFIGSLIGEEWILTAADKLHEEHKRNNGSKLRVEIYVGIGPSKSGKLETSWYEEMAISSKIIFHPDYKPEKSLYFYNIALIQSDTKFNSTFYTATVEIAQAASHQLPHSCYFATFDAANKILSTVHTYAETRCPCNMKNHFGPRGDTLFCSRPDKLITCANSGEPILCEHTLHGVAIGVHNNLVYDFDTCSVAKSSDNMCNKVNVFIEVWAFRQWITDNTILVKVTPPSGISSIYFTAVAHSLFMSTLILTLL